MPAPFRPAAWLPGGHLQTIVPALTPGPRLPAGQPLDVRVATDAAVQVLLHRPTVSPAGTLLVVHGMAGSADSPYVRWCADEALRRGWAVGRLNLRGCGGTEHLTRRLSDASQGDDVHRVLLALERAGLPRPIVSMGYSLGGNLVLLEAGRRGTASAADVIVAVNPPVDLAACVEAIERPVNVLYQWHFVFRLCRLRARASRVWGAGPRPRAWEVRTVRRFDERFTAPAGGWADAASYYADASSLAWLGSIRRPTWIVSSADDPFVPVMPLRKLGADSAVRADVLPAGGHCGFRQAGWPPHWAAPAALDFAAGVAGVSSAARRRRPPSRAAPR